MIHVVAVFDTTERYVHPGIDAAPRGSKPSNATKDEAHTSAKMHRKMVEGSISRMSVLLARFAGDHAKKSHSAT